LPISLPGQIRYRERMNTSILRQRIITHLSALAASVAFLLAGCSTTKNVDWDSRVGRFTYDQAIAELGPPDKQSRLADGTVAVWMTHPSGGGSRNVGGGGYGAAGAGHTVDSSRSGNVLRLTFNADGRLAAWSKNY